MGYQQLYMYNSTTLFSFYNILNQIVLVFMLNFQPDFAYAKWTGPNRFASSMI